MAMRHSLIARRRFGPQTQWRPLRKTLTSGLGLDDMSLARRGSTFGFHLRWHTVELAMSTRLCLLLWLIWFLCFRFDALTELGASMRTDFLCVSVLIVASGPRVKLASCKSALTPTPTSTVGRLTLLTVLRRCSRCYLTLCCFVFYSTRRFVVCLSVCHFVLVFFSPFSIAITSLVEERANLSAFPTFVRFVLVWIVGFLFLLGSGKGCGLWL